MSDLPDYSDETPETPSSEALITLKRYVHAMLTAQNEVEDLETKLDAAKKEFARYSQELIPQLMQSIGLKSVTVTDGAQVVVESKLRTGEGYKLPADGRWREYLEKTGNEGLVKREFRVAYGRDEKKWAETFAQMLRDAGVGEHAKVTQIETIHPQTLVAFLKEQRKEHPDVVEIFRVFEQTIASVVTK